MGKSAELKVVAPIGVFRQSGSAQRQAVPARRWDGPLEILHPRWLYPPGGTWLNPLFLAAQLFGSVARLRKSFRFQLIDAHFAYPDGIAAAYLASLLRLPFSVTLRGNETMHAGRSPAIRSTMRWALRRATRVITVSESLRQFAISLDVRPELVKTIPNGIDSEIYSPRDRNQSRRRHSLPVDRPIVLSVGALIERKGHHRAVEALASLRAKGLHPLLLIVGAPGPEGRFEDKIRAAVADLKLENEVIFFGQAGPDTVAELMSAADVLCLATTREGWPNVVSEALACGTPVVATDVGGIPEMIPSERYGIVVPANHQERLAEALERALRNQWDRDEIARKGRERSWCQVAREVLAEFEEAVPA
jgi:glycosyltransferase involved in cell wall biosynthesis